MPTYEYTSPNNGPTVTPIDPTNTNKAPMLVLWLYMTTDKEYFAALNNSVALKQQLATDLETTVDAIDSAFSRVANKQDFYNDISDEMLSFAETFAYQGGPIPRCTTAPSIGSITASAAVGWTL